MKKMVAVDNTVFRVVAGSKAKRLPKNKYISKKNMSLKLSG